MSHLYRPTTWVRATLSEKGAHVLGPDTDAPAGSYRHVTVCIPESPDIELALDVAPCSAGSRDAYWPRPPLNKTLCISLLPHQRIVGRSITGVAEVSVIVEFRSGAA